MRSSRFVVPAVVGLLVLPACTSSSTSGSSRDASDPAIPSEVLLLDTDAGHVTVDAPGGSVLFEASGTIAAPDGSLLYRTIPQAGSTIVEAIDPSTGATASSTRVTGSFEAWVVSGSGGALALMEPLPNGWDGAVPFPRPSTTIVVVDPTGVAEPRRYELEGNFEPEAFSTDDENLFLIQHLPAETPSVYRVTRLDLDRGKVRPVFGPFKSPPERMPGTRLQQELGPGGDRLYTLYSSSRPGYGPHGAPVDPDAAISFVHVLDLDEGWAHCAGLPEELWGRPASAQAMAVSPGGRRLFVVDAELGVLTVMHTRSFEILRTARLPIGVPEPAGTSARLSADGATLFVAAADGGVVHAIDTATFEVVGRWDVGTSISGLGLSNDGARLYAALGDRLAVLDASTGSRLGAVPVASPAPILRVSAIAA